MGRGGILFGAAEESPTLIAVAIAAVIGTNPRAAAAAGTADGCGRIIEIVAIIQSNSGNNPSAAFPPPPFRPQLYSNRHTHTPESRNYFLPLTPTPAAILGKIEEGGVGGRQRLRGTPCQCQEDDVQGGLVTVSLLFFWWRKEGGAAMGREKIG